MIKNIHASLICYKESGILITGKSGSGKSDLALRFILEHGATLVADDRVNIEQKGGSLYGSAPDELFGKLEIRNIGIVKFPAVPKAEIKLCTELCAVPEETERMPYPETVDFLGVSVTKIKLYPFECSTLCKIIAKLNTLAGQDAFAL